jgi:hypothetical protein
MLRQSKPQRPVTVQVGNATRRVLRKILADHYLRTELGAQPALVKSIWCDPDAIYCIVAYEDGREVRVTLKYQPGYVIAEATRPAAADNSVAFMPTIVYRFGRTGFYQTQLRPITHPEE